MRVPARPAVSAARTPEPSLTGPSSSAMHGQPSGYGAGVPKIAMNTTMNRPNPMQ